MTLLTGFLGAGKTTLLNAVLAGSALGPVAVIVNEFGEAGLDHDLIASADDEIMLMQSGCLCCSVRGDLSRTMIELLARKNRGEIAFDRVMIETTGLADPGPILQTMLMDPYLGRYTRVDGVVTVVDAVNGPATLDAQFEAVSQVGMADLVVLSKTDLAEKRDVDAFEQRLKGINSSARILRATKGADVADHIAGLHDMRDTAQHADILSWTTGQQAAPDPLANLSGMSSAAPIAATAMPHGDRIQTASIVLDQPVSDYVFDRWLETLIALRGDNILRVKGIVFLEGFDDPFVFHGVQHIFDPPVQLKDWPKDDRKSRVVVIARDMSQRELSRSLDMLRAQHAPKAGSDGAGAPMSIFPRS